jgi:hypothetical protein
MRSTWRVTLLAICVLSGAAVPGDGIAQKPAQSATTFAGHVASLSEPEGYFDTDNLISNEHSYLSVLPELQRRQVRGGAYIGVGPDQNFSYIADVRPAIAFIVDVRRDNLLLHLLFKSLFAIARTRAEYLALLCGRRVPENVDRWSGKTIEELVAFVDATSPADRASIEASRATITARITTFGVPLSAADLATIDRFHRRFIESGLDLRFQSIGRPPQLHYPMLRELLLGVDAAGRHGNYLASEEAFLFVRSLQARDLVIPVVGDLSGPSALAAIARMLDERHERLSAFYASNVEFYLFREGRFARFVENLGRIPRAGSAVVIRSVFGGGGGFGGGRSMSITQPVSDLLDGYARGRYREYWELTR